MLATSPKYFELGGLPGDVPVGTFIEFAAVTPPDGFLECDGSEISRATYLDLFNVLGETWGAGDGSTTFLLPESRGEFLRGWDNGAGVDGSRVFASSQVHEIRSHGHTHVHQVNDTASGGSRHAIMRGGNTSTTQSTGGPESRPVNNPFLVCVRY